MENPIKQIYSFNEKAGLLNKGYNDVLESSFIVEEAVENFNLEGLNGTSSILEDNLSSPKEFSRALINIIATDTPLTDVQRLDKACDQVVFAVGAMAKLGLRPNQITKALNVVMRANMAKLGCPKDEMGKLMKPADFDEKYAPEPQLQKILNERE